MWRDFLAAGRARNEKGILTSCDAVGCERGRVSVKTWYADCLLHAGYCTGLEDPIKR